MSNSCPVNSCRSASQTAPSRLDGKGTAAIFHNTLHLMITGRFQKAHIQLLARYCAHKHRFPPPKCGCVFLVCAVWRRRNAGAGAPFHTSSLTDERHDTMAQHPSLPLEAAFTAGSVLVGTSGAGRREKERWERRGEVLLPLRYSPPKYSY